MKEGVGKMSRREVGEERKNKGCGSSENDIKW